MERLTLSILLLCGLVCSSQAGRPIFSVQVSDEFTYVGKCVKFIQTTTLTEPGPLNFKFKVPFNTTAYMRILRFEMQMNDSLTITGSKTPNFTSSGGKENVNDMVSVDLGRVTPIGTMDIVIKFCVQLLEHPQFTNGENLWVNLGAEFTNGSIWAHSHAIKSFVAIDPKPVLNSTTKVLQMENDDVLVGGSTVHVHFRLTHNPHESTATANSVNITLLHPEYLVYSSMVKSSGSAVNVQSNGHSTTSRIMAVGAFNYLDSVDLNFTFTIDPAKTKAKGEIHKAFVGFEVVFAYSSPFYGTPRRGYMKRPPYNTIKFYSERDACDTALGMVSGTIADNMLRSSSDSVAGSVDKGRLNGIKAWIPTSALKRDGNQFIEVNLQTIKEIKRISLKGNGDGVTGSYVKWFRVFYSLDCILWKTYKTKNNVKVLKGNTGPDKVAMVTLVPSIIAKCIRINPRSYHKEIALRFELYGCASSLSPVATNLNSRTYLVDSTTNYIYISSVPMIRQGGQACCYFSKDSGASWNAIDYHILNINFVNPATKHIYGQGLRNTYFMCPAEPKGKCDLIQKAEFDQAKVAAGVQLAKNADKITVTDDASSKIPANADTFVLANGKKLGASPYGIHVWENSAWNLKTSWVLQD